jgi:isoleucyl-tRNA synthetase
VRRYWEDKRIPQRLAEHRKGKKKFFLLDGPPYINALPHVGHVKTTTCKDIWTRFEYMRGFDAFVQPGFDCHGLPVEVIVENELGIRTKHDIERFGIDKFDAACLAKILNNEKVWVSVYRELGALRAYYEPYFTYKNYYIESAWWTLKRLQEKGFLYEGKKAIHWCPKCETALSGYEVSDSYKDVTDPGVYVKFKVKGKENEFLLVFTTTPWTLPSNVAIFAASEAPYVRVRTRDDVGREEILILAKDLVKQVFELAERDYEIIEEFFGKDLDGLEYEPLLDCEQQDEVRAHPKGLRVYMSLPLMKGKVYKKHVMKAEQNKTATKEASSSSSKNGEEQPRGAREEFGEFVTTTDGTGLVHCAPGHGQTDNLIGKEYGLPEASPLDERGCFTEKVGRWRGQFVKAADKEIVEALEREGKLFLFQEITHSYPLCWRCKTPLVFRLSDQWYLSVEPIKDKMISDNETTRWLPPFGQQAFHNWLVDAQDWCVSQQRFWGIPMPIWECDDKKCNHKEFIGGVDELRKKAVKDPGELADLHRHTVDSIKLRCAKCGGSMTRAKDIFNVWFDSAISPWASLGYPKTNKALFEEMFPLPLVCESQDQIRGWFYVLQFAARAAFDAPSYRACAMMGWVLDERGEKMSKSAGNVIWARDGIAQLGADVIRLYYCWELAPWEIQKFSLHTAKEIQRLLNVVWNSLAFLKTYAPRGFKADDAMRFTRPEDAWLASRLNTVTREVTQHLESFEFHHAGRKLVDFAVNDFSRWYIKLVRDRMSETGGDAAQSRRECAEAMRRTIAQLAKLLAPFCPFLSEEIYSQLREYGGADANQESVHYCLYPSAKAGASDEALEERMSFAASVAEAVNSLRKANSLKLRAPVREVVIVASGEDAAKAKQAVESLQSIMRDSANALSVRFSEKEPSFAAVYELKEAKVFLDTAVDDELRALAFVREVSRNVQDARKRAGLRVLDEIESAVVAGLNSEQKKALESRLKELAASVRARSFALAEHAASDFSSEAKIDGVAVKIFLKR